MKVGGGLNNEGLIFGYDSEGFKFGGEPTTNLVPNGGVGGMSGISLGDLGIEDGWRKYSLSGTFAGGTYPYIMYISSATFTGGVKYSSQVKIKTNVASKFNYFAANGISYVNEPQDHGGVNTSELQSDGSYHLRRQGFAYTNTTSQVGYLWTNPINNTTFDPATDFVWVKDVQIEQKDHCTKFVNGTRSNTESLIDLGGNRTLDVSNIEFTSSEYPHFHGSSHHIDLSDNPQNGEQSASWEFITKFDVIYPTDTSVYRQLYIQESSIWIAQYSDRKVGIDIAKDNGSWFDGNGGTVTGSMIGPFNTNTWYHIVFTWDGSNVKGYLNGELGFTTAVSGLTSIRNGATPRRIGRRTNNPFFGDIPVIRLYNKSLSGNEVTQNYLSFKSRFGLS